MVWQGKLVQGGGPKQSYLIHNRETSAWIIKIWTYHCRYRLTVGVMSGRQQAQALICKVTKTGNKDMESTYIEYKDSKSNGTNKSLKHTKKSIINLAYCHRVHFISLQDCYLDYTWLLKRLYFLLYQCEYNHLIFVHNWTVFPNIWCWQT